MSTGDSYNDLLKPMSWLFGKWTSDQGKAIYPTMSDFVYEEEAKFAPVGMKPVIQYSFNSWHPTSKVPLHEESGFIQLKPNTNKIAFTASHIFGVVEILEGEVNGQSLTVETTQIARSSFNKPPAVKKLRRTLALNGDNKLDQGVDMETENTALIQHLTITYNKATD